MNIDEITHTAGCMIAASIDETVTEIEIVISKIRSGKSIFERFSFSDHVKLDSHAIAEIYAGIAFTASLTAYRREGEAWRFDYADRNSARGKQITASLDALCDLLIAHRYEAFRFCCRPTSPSHVVRSLALLFLALDAVDPRSITAFKSLAGIHQSCGDPQGDAQMLTEEHHLSPAHGLWAEPEFKQKSRKSRNI